MPMAKSKFSGMPSVSTDASTPDLSGRQSSSKMSTVRQAQKNPSHTGGRMAWMAQPDPVQCLHAEPETFWISGLSMLGATQQTVHPPHSRPGTNVIPSHMGFKMPQVGDATIYKVSPPSSGE